MATAKIKDPLNGFEIDYYIDDRLKTSLDKKVIPSLHQKDKDCVIVVDGKEGAGKSTFAFQFGKYVDPSLNLSRVVFDPDSFREAVFKAKKGQCIIYDEAFTGYSSRNSLSPINRVLVSLAMQMRQKNLMVIIVLPTIFLLDKYMALFRTRALIHVFESKGRRGYFKLYNARVKKLLILLGKKTFSYKSKGVWTNFNGRFYGKFALGDDILEKEYRIKKEKALENSEKTPMTARQIKYQEQRNILIHLCHQKLKMGYREIEQVFEEFGFDISFVQINEICTKFGDKDSEKDKEYKKNKKDKVETEGEYVLDEEISEKEPKEEENESDEELFVEE